MQVQRLGQVGREAGRLTTGQVLRAGLAGHGDHRDGLGGRLGAQPSFARTPALAEILALHALAPIRVITLAPDGDEALALVPQLVQAGMRVQIGHSAASYEQALQALQQGASGFTHLFNAMSALHHREPAGRQKAVRGKRLHRGGLEIFVVRGRDEDEVEGFSSVGKPFHHRDAISG